MSWTEEAEPSANVTWENEQVGSREDTIPFFSVMSSEPLNL